MTNKMPKYMGFNLLDMFTMRSKGEFQENDFKFMADWGFNFVRLPLCYTLWLKDINDVYSIDEAGLEKIDKAVKFGEKYGIHVDINFHRAPGFSVNGERKEPFSLWKDKEAQDAFVFHWELMAKRYKGISSEKVSFNLVNEPLPVSENMSEAEHNEIMERCIGAIKAIDSQRLVVIDGFSWATIVNNTIKGDIVQSCRAYSPFHMSHYKASWVGRETWGEAPFWPGKMEDGQNWDIDKLRETYKPWKELVQSGVGVHCGEGGCYKFTDHASVVKWLDDVLTVLDECQIGLALWNFRGEFGIMDSNRPDCDYTDYQGHKLDKQMLDVFRKHL